MKKTIFLVFLLISIKIHSQSNWDNFLKLSPPKKTWVILHLFKARKALEISKETQKVTDSIASSNLLDGDKNGGQVDAFRHAYWMARLKQKIGKSAAKSLGKAHEKENYLMFKKRQLEDGALPDKIATDMDLYNNSIGLTLTEKNMQQSKIGLIYKVINAILNGDLKIIKKDAQGNYLTCDDKIIPKDSLHHKWINNKCLVKSNYKKK